MSREVPALTSPGFSPAHGIRGLSTQGSVTLMVSLRGLHGCCVLSCSVVSDSCDPMDSAPPDCPVLGISQARILEWVAISYCRGSPRPRDQTCIDCGSCTGWQILYHWAPWEALRASRQRLNTKPRRDQPPEQPWGFHIQAQDFLDSSSKWEMCNSKVLRKVYIWVKVHLLHSPYKAKRW